MICVSVRSDPDRVAGDGEWFVAGRRGRRVFDLPAQVFHPVLQVLLVGAHHLEPLKHRPYGSRKGTDECRFCFN